MNGNGEQSVNGMANAKRNVEWSHAEAENPGKNVDNHDDDYVRLDDSKMAPTRTRSSFDILATSYLLWPVFVISVLVGSSSAPITLSMKGVGPVSLAGWRHQVTALALLPFFLYQWVRLSKMDRHKVFVSKNLGLMFMSMLSLAGHFSFYFWALYHTSMTHCLFLTSMSPIFVAIHSILVGRVLLKMELIGVTLGLFGVAILGAGTSVEKDNVSTYLGDFMALIAAVSMSSYLIVGKSLRRWMPLFVYQFPAALGAGVVLAVVGLLLEGWNGSHESGNISGPFGWLRKEYLLGTVLLGVGPGILGHAGYSFVLRYSSPLVMPTGLSLQPIIGSTLGWALGQSAIPGLWTCIGGLVTLAGTCCVSCANAHQKEDLETKEEEYQQPAADEEGQQGTKPLLQPSERP